MIAVPQKQTMVTNLYWSQTMVSNLYWSRFIGIGGK
jgi:hypothetical protein